jgi:small-conductance mechanosensitive channel
VAYEINAYTNQAAKMEEIYSTLHQNIQDAFNRAGVEIMSPAYSAIRDGNTVTIPAKDRPADYEPDSFRVRRT